VATIKNHCPSAASIWDNGAAGGVIYYIMKKSGEGAANVMLLQSIRISLVKAEDSICYRSVLSVNGNAGKLVLICMQK
jgi:hypothetical protein